MKRTASQVNISFPKGAAKRKPAKRTRTTYAPIGRNPGAGFPIKKRCVLRYSQVVTPDLTGGYGSHSFRANSLFDPDYDGTGHQPRGFDQWVGIYNKYRVISATFTMRAVPAGTTNVVPSGFALVPFNTTGDLVYMSQGIAGVDEISRRSRVGVSGFSATEQQNLKDNTVTYKVDLAKWLGRPLNDDDIGGSTTNPTTSVFVAAVGTSIASNTPGDSSYLISIEYDCEFFDVKLLAAS